ncbi:LOW QUALITY PROTEIN: transmembrane protein 269 [Petaurus breviceps papuanus]|uniref:LOW QUALITY PROTEIN: transmembrane protein 269 n=1 Tax=Petaurus breviceps papuanus TaxID=3040969 RepID=UPI0036DBAC8F
MLVVPVGLSKEQKPAGRKNAANILSLGNIVLGLSSIFCSFNRLAHFLAQHMPGHVVQSQETCILCLVLPHTSYVTLELWRIHIFVPQCLVHGEVLWSQKWPSCVPSGAGAHLCPFRGGCPLVSLQRVSVHLCPFRGGCPLVSLQRVGVHLCFFRGGYSGQWSHEPGNENPVYTAGTTGKCLKSLQASFAFSPQSPTLVIGVTSCYPLTSPLLPPMCRIILLSRGQAVLDTALLLLMDGPLSGMLTTFDVLAVFFHLCFWSAGIPFMYQGLPCPYASSLLPKATSLLTKGNKLLLQSLVILMMDFMLDQCSYPQNKILESQFSKVIFGLGEWKSGFILSWCSFSMNPFYYLVWATFYIFFPTTIWNKVA